MGSENYDNSSVSVSRQGGEGTESRGGLEGGTTSILSSLAIGTSASEL